MMDKYKGTTLLLLDLQKGIVSQVPGDMEGFLTRTELVLQQARAHGINVIHVNTAFRLNYPEAHVNNLSLQTASAQKAYQEGDLSVELHTSAKPLPTEPTVTKRRVSAFFGTDLDILLRASQTTNLVIGGLITSGAVLSTVRSATDLDYKVEVLRDVCMDRDEEVHNILMDKIFPRHTTVVTVEDWIAKTF